MTTYKKTNAALTYPSATCGEPSAYSQCTDARPDVTVMSAEIAAIQYMPAGSGWREGAIKVELKLRFYT